MGGGTSPPVLGLSYPVLSVGHWAWLSSASSLSPLGRCVYGDGLASALSHIGRCACGDGSYSFSIPYRALSLW